MAAAESNPASSAAPACRTLVYLHTTRQDVPQRHPQAVSLAFEASQFPVLVKNDLVHQDPVIVSKALHVCLSHLPQPLNVSKALAAGILGPLSLQSRHADTVIRRRVARCFQCIGMDRATGHTALGGDSTGLTALKTLMGDDDVEARRSSAEAALGMANWFRGASALVSGGFVDHLVARADCEADSDLLGTVLLTLSKCVNAHGQQGVADALAGSCVDVCTRLLAAQMKAGSAANAGVVAGCAATLMQCAVPGEGKQQVIKAGAIPHLLGVVAGTTVPVSHPAAASAAGALMNVCIEDDGKRGVLEVGTTPLLDALFAAAAAFQQGGTLLSLLLNCLRTIGTLCSHPAARSSALEAGVLPLIDDIILPAAVAGGKDVLTRLATKTRGVVDWKP